MSLMETIRERFPTVWSAPSGNPVAHLHAPRELRLRPYEELDSPGALRTAERGHLVPVHANSNNYQEEHGRFEKYDHTIGLHGMWVPSVSAVPEYLVGSRAHGQRKQYDWCRQDGAYYIAPRVRKFDWEESPFTRDYRQYCYNQRQYCYNQTRGWASPPYFDLGRSVGGVSVVLLVQPEGYVCIDRNLSEGEFVATRLKVLDVLGERTHTMRKNHYWEANKWVDNPAIIDVWLNNGEIRHNATTRS